MAQAIAANNTFTLTTSNPEALHGHTFTVELTSVVTRSGEGTELSPYDYVVATEAAGADYSLIATETDTLKLSDSFQVEDDHISLSLVAKEPSGAEGEAAVVSDDEKLSYTLNVDLGKQVDATELYAEVKVTVDGNVHYQYVSLNNLPESKQISFDVVSKDAIDDLHGKDVSVAIMRLVSSDVQPADSADTPSTVVAALPVSESGDITIGTLNDDSVLVGASDTVQVEDDHISLSLVAKEPSGAEGEAAVVSDDEKLSYTLNVDLGKQVDATELYAEVKVTVDGNVHYQYVSLNNLPESKQISFDVVSKDAIDDLHGKDVSVAIMRLVSSDVQPADSADTPSTVVAALPVSESGDITIGTLNDDSVLVGASDTVQVENDVVTIGLALVSDDDGFSHHVHVNDKHESGDHEIYAKVRVYDEDGHSEVEYKKVADGDNEIKVGKGHKAEIEGYYSDDKGEHEVDSNSIETNDEYAHKTATYKLTLSGSIEPEDIGKIYAQYQVLDVEGNILQAGKVVVAEDSTFTIDKSLLSEGSYTVKIVGLVDANNQSYNSADYLVDGQLDGDVSAVTVSLVENLGAHESDDVDAVYTLNVSGEVKDGDIVYAKVKVVDTTEGASHTPSYQYVEVKDGNSFTVDTTELHGHTFAVEIVSLVNGDTDVASLINTADYKVGSYHSDTFTVENDAPVITLTTYDFAVDAKGQNNGWGNGDDSAPGNSGLVNQAENNPEHIKTNPSHSGTFNDLFDNHQQRNGDHSGVKFYAGDLIASYDVTNLDRNDHYTVDFTTGTNANGYYVLGSGSDLGKVFLTDAGAQYYTAHYLDTAFVFERVSLTVVSSEGDIASTSGSPDLSIVPQAPVITTDASFDIYENQKAVTTVHATDLDSPTLTYSIAGGADASKFTINSTTGALSFVNAPDYENPTDSSPYNSYLVNVQVSDGTNSTTQLITVNVKDVNEFTPTITSNGGGNNVAIDVNENTTSVTTVTATDGDTGALLTYSLVGGDDQLKFTIDPTTGVLSFKNAPDYENPTDSNPYNSYHVDVQVSDGSKVDTQSITVNVKNVNEAPVITSGGAGSVVENAATNTVVYTVAATDPDAGTKFIYSLSGDDAGLFDINNKGEVTLKASANYEAKTSYNINVIASDGALSDTKAVTINVTNVNEAPTITSGATGTVAENAATSTVVYTAAATDPDAHTTLAYSLSGTDATLFNINSSTGAVTLKASANYEAKTSYNINVIASDGALSDTKAVTINVTNVNEAPTITSGATGTVAENAATSTVVYTAAATDPDAHTTLAYSLSGTDATLFNINSSTGAVTLKASANYEAKTSYNINVIASDGALSDTKAVTINVTNVNEAPTLSVVTSGSVTDSATSTSLSNSDVSNLSGTLVGADVDAGSVLTYGIDAGSAVNYTSGNVTYDISKAGAYGVLHLESSTGKYLYVADATAVDLLGTGDNPSDAFTFSVSDGALNAVQNFTVNITGANEIINGTGAGNTLTGSAGADTIDGKGGADTLSGGAGDDVLIGGSGNDTLTGGTGADTFKWALGDQGSVATPAVDHITDFSVSQGDKLDLKDLLQGESKAATSGNSVLGNYLSVAVESGKVTISVDHDGTANGAGSTQKIVLDNYTTNAALAHDLGIADNSSSAAIITALINSGKLITD